MTTDQKVQAELLKMYRKFTPKQREEIKKLLENNKKNNDYSKRS